MNTQNLNRPKLIIEEDEEYVSFHVDKLLEPYKNNDLLPIFIIDKLLENSFKSCQILHEYNHYHKIIKIKISDLLSANISNWKYNRPADLTRCIDIARYIYITKNNIDTMLYISFTPFNISNALFI
jgi:hypothetical protein